MIVAMFLMYMIDRHVKKKLAAVKQNEPPLVMAPAIE
jgi:hypothetical protein